MTKARFLILASFIATLTLCANCPAIAAKLQQVGDASSAVVFFDVLDLPARIDEPKLSRSKDRYLLNCAVANRSGEQLLGLRLVLMTVDANGKLRARVAWSEVSDLAAYSIKTFQFSFHFKEKAQSGDRHFLAIDEVLGSETIWRAVDAEKALRAYSRGQHDIVPKVKAVANKDDRQFNPVVIPLKLRKP
jgi:hypothetical protein